MERQMTLVALGLGGGKVRVEIAASAAVMNVDLDRRSAVTHAASVLLHAGVSAIRVSPDGSYDVEAKCRCPVGSTTPDVIPAACPVHGVPCEQCGGVESCAETCGDAQ